MAFFSANQEIDIRYKEEVISADVNKKTRDLLGLNAKMSGLTLSHVSGLNCKINAGRIIILGAAIEEFADISIPIPSNAGNPIKTHYLYATYTHGDGLVCSYELLESTTLATNYLLIGTVYMPAGATVVTAGNVTSVPATRGLAVLDALVTAISDSIGPLTTRVTTAEGKITTAEGKIATAEGTIASHTTSIGTINTNATTLTGRVTTAEGKITVAEGKITTAEGTIVSHTTSIGTINTNATTLAGRVTTAEGKITVAEGKITTAETAILNKLDWSNKATKQTEQINKLNIGGALMEVGGATPTGTTAITLNAYLTATKMFNGVFKDYAEWFERGEATEPGDIISLERVNSDETYVKADKYFNNITVGIHSDEYAICVGADGAETDIEKYIPVGMMGRVKVKVKGIVQAGDYIALSDEPGIGVSVSKDKESKYIVGKALEDSLTFEVRRVKCYIMVD